MKTTEEKAKAYDEIIERAKTMLSAGEVMYGKENNASQLITDLIPELADSEDEKIYEEIYSIVHHCYQDRIDNLVNPERKKEQLDKWGKAKDWLEKQKEPKEYHPLEDYSRGYNAGYYHGITDSEQKPAIMKPHKGDDNNPYDMRVSEAQEYAIKRGFGIPFNDGEVFVDERYITQTIGNILRWADEHPKAQKPAEKQDYSGLTDFERAIHRGFLAAGIENVPVTIIKETAKDCPQIKFRSVEEARKACEPDYVILKKEDYERLQKPAEWSEEDEKKIHFLSRLIEFQVKDDEYCFGEGFRMISKQEAIEMLKSLRPSWKPSEEQMDILDKVYHYLWADRNATADMQDGLGDLIDELKKL